MAKPNRDKEHIFIDLVNLGLLRVDEDGTITNTKTGNILGKKPNNRGYHAIGIKIDGKIYHILTHRLVYLVHNGPILDDEPYINHTDGNKSNNHKDNLIACTIAENNQHAFDTGLRTMTDVTKKKLSEHFSGSKHPKAKFTNEQILEIRKLHGAGFGCRKIGKVFDCSHSTIAGIVKGKTYREELNVS